VRGRNLDNGEKTVHILPASSNSLIPQSEPPTNYAGRPTSNWTKMYVIGLSVVLKHNSFFYIWPFASNRLTIYVLLLTVCFVSLTAGNTKAANAVAFVSAENTATSNIAR